MQNSVSGPPRDQGDGSRLSAPVEKQLTPAMADSPRKTVCAGELSPPTPPPGKGLQSKSQFRSIAPKIAPKVLPPRVLSCHAAPLSDRATPGPAVTAKPLGMPAQNYALMQVAGHEGTFSLVALPQVAAAQPMPKPRVAPPENLKLPIPRYQPPRNNRATGRKPGPPPQPQASPSPAEPPEPPRKPVSTEQVSCVAPAPTAVSTAGRAGPGDHPSPVASEQGPADSAVPLELPAKQGLRKTPRKAASVSKIVPSAPDAEAGGKREEQVNVAKAVTVLSPAILGSTVQLVPPVPRGKLPILPYARSKAADARRADLPLPGPRAEAEKPSPLPAAPPAAKQHPGTNASGPAAKPELHHKAKLSGGPGKRRGRKRKVPEDMLAFQGKRRKSLLSKCRESRERAKSPQEPRDHKAEALRRYRSIMPKPVLVVPALAPLAPPAALLPAPAPGRPAQAAQGPIPLPGKQEAGPRRSAGFRNGFSWHRCHVCDHHFQFKQHLRDHMSTHTNRSLHRCRVCLKAYVRSGNLSTHMRLQHSESRLKKLVCCEFCAKVFGHVRVYFGHLKEVHRVVISTEPSPAEPQPGDPPRHRDASVRWPEGAVERESKSNLEDLLLNQADEVKLQIRCGRCQITAPSFADIKFHLLYAHGEEIQGRLQEAAVPGSRGAPGAEEPLRPAAAHWKHPEKRKATASTEEPHASPDPETQPSLPPQNEEDTKEPSTQPGPGEPGDDQQALEGPGAPGPRPGFNCILCAQTWGQKEELLRHWGQRHSCEDPPRLWAILSALSQQGAVELSRATEQ